MSRIVNVSQGDYRVRVQRGGTITLDTGVDIGTVVITGDLLVKGVTTTIDTTNLTIEDNITLLNKGEIGAGITEGSSGFEIDRGSLRHSLFVFDESVTHFNPLPVNATSISSFTNAITLDTVIGLAPNSAIVFQGLTFAGSNIVIGTTYYIKTIVNSTITISASRVGSIAGPVFVLTNTPGIVSAVVPINILAQPGTFVFDYDDGTLSGIQTNSITTKGTTDLVFDLQGSDKLLRLANVDAQTYSAECAGSLPYQSTPTGDALNDNIIPNRRWVTDYVASGALIPGQADVDRYYKSTSSIVQSEGSATTTGLEFKVRSSGTLNLRGKFTASGFTVDNVNVFNNTINNISQFDNLILTATNNQIQVDGVLNLDAQLSDPIGVNDTNRLYSKAPGTGIGTPGKTGLYFTNTLTSDELIAKNRALLFSMLF